MAALAGAQAPQPTAPADQQPTAQAPPAQPAAPAQQPTAETPPAQPETRRLRLPPAPPKVVDVRMPGEAGWSFGLTGWLPVGKTWTDKGRETTFTDPSKLQLAGKSRGAFGAEIGIAAGLHNSIRISYFFNKQSGTTFAPNDLVLYSLPYNKGDELTTNSKLSNYKVSYEYLTWPYPVEGRHFRLKTLWQAQAITVRTVYDAPVRSGTPDSDGVYTDYSTLGTKTLITPTIGLGFHEYATRNFRFEANVSGFMLPHRFHVLDTDATIAYRVGHFELRGGAKGLIFRTSPKTDYFYRGTVGGGFVGIRWYSD